MTTVTGMDALLGQSPAMRELRSMIDRVSRTQLSVLVHGETGSGKELVARALHAASRRAGSLVAINVCALGESMFEASLFGHVRGAFTGAVADSRGFLAEANGGTLFLDEISGLPLAAQAKLLRAVETREFRPLGARMDRCSDFRVVAATNEELRSLVTAGRFRADLLQRLSGVHVRVPPLRARIEDIPVLATHFASGRARFSAGSVRRLQEHGWPGNVRELRHVIECAIALAQTEVLDVNDVEPLLGPVDDAPMPMGRVGHVRQELLQVLEEAGWDVDAAAKRLGVHRATIYRRLKRVSSGVRAAPVPSLAASADTVRLQLEA